MFKKSFFLLCFLATVGFYYAEGQYFIKDPNAISLNGEWLFALDPSNIGQSKGWYEQDFPKNHWDSVRVPHCFSVDPRYQYYTGAVWYRRMFPWEPQVGKRVILHFDAIYYATSIWINNRNVGAHEGGYTPFELDITNYLKKGRNTIALSIDNNTWEVGTVPGAKDYGMPGDPFMGWMNYGGITRSVYLTIEPETYIANIKIESTPDLDKGNAAIKVISYLNHLPNQPVTDPPTLSVRFLDRLIKLKWEKPLRLSDSCQISVWEARAVMDATSTRLWDLDDPNLYELQAVLGADTVKTRFGIRKVEVKNAHLFLNGHLIRAAGANRVIDYPGLGSLEPDSLIERDFRMMKGGGMIFQRMTHYTPSEYFYELADKHGMLIIAEAGNWQLTPDQMDNVDIREKYRSQLLEMIHRDWNHPSVIAYSVGNEYLSESSSGKRWTRDMIAFGRKLDGTRLFTFVSKDLNKMPERAEDESSIYCDFVCTNTYGNHRKVLEHIHNLYPEKPVLLSEWGLRVDRVGDSRLIQHIEEVTDVIREYPYIMGASIWTYNDYESRFLGTNKNGYRGWGLVDSYRNPRPSYFTYQKEMSPVAIKVRKQERVNNGEYRISIQLLNRKDFPSYPIHNYTLKAGNVVYQIPDMIPGDTATINVFNKGFDSNLKVALYTPTNFCIMHQNVKVNLFE